MEKNKYEIKYLPSYINDLIGILNYITNNLQNLQAAERLLNSINDAIKKRSLCPQSFEKYNRARNSKYIWYRIYVGNYTIFYTVLESTMEIVHILSSNKNFNNLI